MPGDDGSGKDRADALLKHGLGLVSRGELDAAKADFQASAEALPTADAFTYWGWMEHHLGNTERAIELCRQAIAVDPDFGNPYNDIGSYLVSQGKAEEAIPWFEQAIGAPRYEPRQFPHMNLGRVYLQMRRLPKALEHFQKALGYAPGDQGLLATVGRLKAALRTLN